MDEQAIRPVLENPAPETLSNPAAQAPDSGKGGLDVPALVQAVVSAVLGQLHQDIAKPCVHVVGGCDEKAAAAVSQALGTEIAPCRDGAERRILPFLSCRDMADLASGRASSPAASEVLELLLQGQRIEVLEYEYRAYENTASGALYRLYARQAGELAEFGLVPFVRPCTGHIRVWESVITAEHVRQAVSAGVPELQVLKTALVTPLAADQAQLDGITISRIL
ncbi:MAG: hypothetical protein Q4F72_01130 [Desulfovibrionaceae bacterium]|nr:hypothetical protein [Desulfovibrionaceae bacterium]